MKNFFKLKELIKKFIPSMYSIAGSFIITAGWNWYHVAHRPHGRFIVVSLITWFVVFVGYRVAVMCYEHGIKRLRVHPFWQEEFRRFLDPLFFQFSFIFLIFFFRDELLSLVYISALFLFLFWRLQRYLSRHPAAHNWLVVNRTVFLLSYFIFAVQALVQYISYTYYILDANARFFNIVFFRAWAMAMFWMLGFVVVSFFLVYVRSKARYVFASIWALFFATILLFWTANIAVLYYSGLHFSPSVLEHARGSEGLVINTSAIGLAAGFVIALVAFVIVFKQTVRAHHHVEPRYWYYYQGAILVIAAGSLVGFSSFKNTPERIVVNSFYQYYFGETTATTLDPVIVKKLEKFGLNYHPDTFFVAEKRQVFSPTSTAKLFPDRLKKNPPNILIVFLESYSARLTSVYSDRFPGLTPGLEKMAADKNTTIFKNYYNASTPTVTGLLSQLCSFLPPTGHGEIQEERKLQRHRLLCLPEVLKKERGYGYTAYITSVEKDYAHKDGLFESMGTDEVYGKVELKKFISDEPKTWWGYSDHQLFPFTWQLLQEKSKQKQPVIVMLSTVDTHPPFNLASDAVPYGNGKNDLLNSFHTTDNAFEKFWDEFKKSPLAGNTIVVAVGDHAVFPAAFTKDTFPDVAGKLNFYDENAFLVYIPDTVLPKTVDVYASGLDFTPTLLHMFGINIPNSFEGHSIFDDRKRYPNVLGMHELGLYINQVDKSGKRKIDYNVPNHLECPNGDAMNRVSTADNPLTLCEYLQFYKWKRQMFEEGRFWKH